MSSISPRPQTVRVKQDGVNSVWVMRLPYLIFLTIFFIDFASIRLGVIPRAATLMTEAFSGIVALAVVIHIARYRSIKLDTKYLVFFFLFCLVMVFGYILNSVSAGTMLIGVRNYLKYTPFFLLPVILNFTDDQMRSQLRFLLFLALLQIPIAISQKFVFHTNVDWIAGTLNIGSVLAMFLLSAIAITFGFFLHGKLRFSLAVTLIILFFLPSTLNESKSVAVFLPMMVVVSVLIAAKAVDKRKIIAVLSLGAGLLVVFIFSYVIFFGSFGAEEDGGENIFLTDPTRAAKHYLFSDTLSNIDPRQVLNMEKRVVGQVPELIVGEDRVARLDSIFLPVVVLSQDISRLAFGLGAGNASQSFIASFSGEFKDFGSLNISIPALPVFLWEIGLLGVAVFLAFFAFIFFDSRYLAKQKDFSASIATGWAAVVVMIILSLPYKPFMTFSVLGVLFWYFSGYIAAKKWSIKRGLK